MSSLEPAHIISLHSHRSGVKDQFPKGFFKKQHAWEKKIAVQVHSYVIAKEDF